MPRDGASLAEQILVMLQDEPLQMRLGTNGRRLIEDHYSLDRMLARLETIYKRMLQRR